MACDWTGAGMKRIRGERKERKIKSKMEEQKFERTEQRTRSRGRHGQFGVQGSLEV